MIFTPADDDSIAQLYCRRVSETQKVEIGVYRVLFGHRVRAGFVGAEAYHIDWCAGNNWRHVEALYSIALSVLSKRQESPECFDGIPRMSRVKPFYLDDEFCSAIADMAKPVHPVRLDNSAIIRGYFNQTIRAREAQEQTPR